MDARTKIPPIIKRNTAFFAASQAFVGTGTQMVPTLGALMVVRLLGSANLAGLASSVLGAGRFLIAYPIGKVNDTYGRKVGLVLGLLLSLTGALLLGISMLATSFILFLVGIAIFGLGVGAGMQMRVAAADMYPPARRAEGLGYVLMGSLVGAMGAPVLISLAQKWSARFDVNALGLAWILVPVVIVPGIVLVLLVRPDPKEIAANLGKYYPGYTAPPQRPNAGNGQTGLAVLLRNYPRQVAFVASLAVQGNMAMMMAMTALVLSHHGHPLPHISFAVSIHVIGMFGLSLPLGRLTDRLGRRWVLVMGLILAGAGSVMVAATSSYWTITSGIFFVGVGWSCVNVAATALIADTTGPAERGRAVGANDAISSAGGIVLPLVAGPMVEYAGLASLGFLGVAIMVVPMFLVLRLRESSPGVYEEKAVMA